MASCPGPNRSAGGGSSSGATVDYRWDAGGQASYFLGFSELRGATATSPGTVVLHVKAVAE
ncbi:hypothetical protein [Sorangium sp. So ce128]|uniref:hypothetical protein n=1 Tax=Sorangium sp. So ce128 TaxID=3133281 RepID=UPI003F5F2269